MRTCATCRLPTSLREQVAADWRRGVPLRSISESQASQGHPVQRDAIHRHVRAHVAPADDLDASGAPEDGHGIIVAATAAGVLDRWPYLARELSRALYGEGLHRAAAVVASAVPETMRAAIDSAAGTEASELREARATVRALGAVLPRHPDAAQELAAELRRGGLDDLARAAQELADCTTDQRPAGSVGTGPPRRAPNDIEELQ